MATENRALVALCNLHNNISPESIHLALMDMEDQVLMDPNQPLVVFLERLLERGQARDNIRYRR